MANILLTGLVHLMNTFQRQKLEKKTGWFSVPVVAGEVLSGVFLPIEFPI
jgi:hypothetical protein